MVSGPRSVVLFLTLLAVPQVVALGEQVALGFRPFGHEPRRVPLSWDMFSVPIARCDVRWTPPLNMDGHSVARLRDTGTALEWDPVYDRVEDYTLAARYGCEFASVPTTAQLRCVTSEAAVALDSFACP